MAKRLHGGSSPTKEQKYKQHPAKLEARKNRRKRKWLRNRERWAKIKKAKNGTM